MGCKAHECRAILLALFPFLFDLAPGVSECDGPVDDELFGRRIAVNTKVPQPLKLKRGADGGAGNGRLQFAPAQHFQRLRVQVRKEGLALGDLVGVGFCEQVIVQADLSLKRSSRVHPVDCAFHFTAVGRVPTQRGGIVCASNFDDIAGRVLDRAGTADEVRITQADLAPRSE